MVPPRSQWLVVFGCGIATFVAAGGWLRGTMRYLAFDDIDYRPITAGVCGFAALIALTRMLQRRGAGNVSPRVAQSWLGLHMAFCAALIAFGVWFSGSPLDPNLYPVAVAYGLSGTWIATLGSGWLYRSKLKHWNAIVLLSLAPVFFFANTVRSSGIDGTGRSMMGWSWQKKSSLPSATELNKEKSTQGPKGESKPSDFQSESWTQFMGKNRSGVADSLFASEQDASAKNLKLVWEVPIGPSWSSCVVEGDLIYTQESANGYEQLVAFQASDGSRRWVSKIEKTFQSSLGGDGSRATPTIHGDYVLALSGSGTLGCFLRSSGAEVWKRKIHEDASSDLLYHGACGSPLCIADNVYVFPGGTDFAVVAYNIASGKMIYHGGKQRTSYASLTQAELCGVPMILAMGGEEFVGYSLDLSRVFFRYPFTNNEKTICSQPCLLDAHQGELLLSAGYRTGCRRLVLSPGTSAEEEWAVKEVWNNKRNLKTKFCSSVAIGDYAFGLDDGVLQCIKLSDGSMVWKDGRYGHGQILLCGAQLLVQCEDGSLALVAASPKFQEIFRSSQLEGKTWNHPCWSKPYLLIRNDSMLRCLKSMGNER